MPADSGLSFSDPVAKVKGIGPSYTEILTKLGIKTVGDILHHFPRRYLDFTKITTIKNLVEKKPQVIRAVLDKPQQFRSRGGKLVTSVTAKDKIGKIKLYWFNSAFIGRQIKPGLTYLIAGIPSQFAGKITIISPQIELDNNDPQMLRSFLPIYPLTAGLTHNWLRHKIKYLLDTLPISEPLPPELVPKNKLLDYRSSLNLIHFPHNLTEKDAADTRLAFNRHLATNIINISQKPTSAQSPALSINQSLHQDTVKSLPFVLTPDQIKAINASYTDLKKDIQTYRLIQGETGSGKTVVVLFLAKQALQNGYSFCLLAPTQILANQHYQSFLKFGISPDKIILVTSQNKLQEIPQQPRLFIGTHALLTQLPDKLTCPLAVVVIDEQHKFGVKQRETLAKVQPTPHIFNLSATPIPRTLALGFFGEINISTIKSQPLNRQAVKTWIVNPDHYQKKSTPWLIDKLKTGAKIFVVCPTIHAQKSSVASVEHYFLDYQKKFRQIADVFLVHGQMKADQMESALSQFKKSRAAILVSTTVIEVGVDIPDAEVMVIHSADRFGLATLHQLRGRVGRGDKPGFCFLVPESIEKTEISRLKLLEKHSSGLVLSKLDIRLRGAGEVFGNKQHGFLPVRLKHFWDSKLFKETKVIAQNLINQNTKQALAIAEKLISW